MKDTAYRAFMKGVPVRGGPSEVEPWDQETHPPKKQPIKRKCKVTIDRAMKQANQAGLSVSSATVTAEGGVKLELGETSNGQHNPWDDVQ